jgi:hypothetical protein
MLWGADARQTGAVVGRRGGHLWREDLADACGLNKEPLC